MFGGCVFGWEWMSVWLWVDECLVDVCLVVGGCVFEGCVFARGWVLDCWVDECVGAVTVRCLVGCLFDQLVGVWVG